MARPEGARLRVAPMRGAIPLLLALACSGGDDPGSPGPPALVLEGATLVDGNGGPSLADATIVVEGSRISAVGPSAHIAVPAGARVVDVRGRTVIPGLVDMHAHVLVPRCSAGEEPRFDRAVSEKMLDVLLRSGITTVRSPSSPTAEGVALRDAVAESRVSGPRIFAAAELIDGIDLDPDEVRAAVRERLRHPVDFIKLYAGLSPAAVRAAIDEAHAHGVPVIGHLGRTSWSEAARMGIDALTHAASWSEAELAPERREAYRTAQAERGAMRARIDWLELLDPEGAQVDTLIGELAHRRIPVDPTLVAYDTKFTDPSDPRYRSNPRRGVVPEMLEDWEACGTPTDDWTPADRQRMRKAWPKLLRLVQRFHEEGVLLTTGSDVTNTWVIPGESLVQELELLVSAGIPPSEVLVLATRNGAEALGILDEAGTIEAGKRADLVVLAADPTRDVASVRSIVAVMQGGRWVVAGPDAAP